jgi:hypothetical protein
MVLVARTAKDSEVIDHAWAVDCGNDKTAIKFVEMLHWLVEDVAARCLLVPESVSPGTRTWMWFDARSAPMEDLAGAQPHAGSAIAHDELVALLIRRSSQKDLPGDIGRDA